MFATFPAAEGGGGGADELGEGVEAEVAGDAPGVEVVEDRVIGFGPVHVADTGHEVISG